MKDEETKFERMKKLRDRHLRKREMLQVSLKSALKTIRDLQLDRNRWIKKCQALEKQRNPLFERFEQIERGEE